MNHQKRKEAKGKEKGRIHRLYSDYDRAVAFLIVEEVAKCAYSSLDKFNSLPEALQADAWVQGQLLYYQHFLSACRKIQHDCGHDIPDKIKTVLATKTKDE